MQSAKIISEYEAHARVWIMIQIHGTNHDNHDPWRRWRMSSERALRHAARGSRLDFGFFILNPNRKRKSKITPTWTPRPSTSTSTAVVTVTVQPAFCN
jgi:hypothetical protein